MSAAPELAGVRHDYLDASGLRTHVALAGSEDAPPVMVVHGWPQHWWEWRDVIRSVAGDYRVIVPDLRGLGWTEAPTGGYDKEQLATDLLAVLDALNLEQVTWVGHDSGGWSGLLAALGTPKRIIRALILSVPHFWMPPHPRQLSLLGYQGPISLRFVGARVAEWMVPGILQAGRRPDPATGGRREAIRRPRSTAGHGGDGPHVPDPRGCADRAGPVRTRKAAKCRRP